MTASANSPEDVVNLALVRIGYKPLIANLYEGTKAAWHALRIYAQTRDLLLLEGQWEFAERNTILTLLKSAPLTGYFPPTLWNATVNPPPPWLYEYAFPADCLKMRSIKPTPLFVMNFEPKHNIYSIDNDNAFSPPQRVILTNMPAATADYVGQVTDPSTWDVEFTDALAAALGKRMAPFLVEPEAAKMATQDEAQATAQAEDIEGENR